MRLYKDQATIYLIPVWLTTPLTQSAVRVSALRSCSVASTMEPPSVRVTVTPVALGSWGGPTEGLHA